MSSVVTPELLEKAKRVLQHLENQAAGFTSLTLPANIAIELEDQRRKVEEMEAALSNTGQTALAVEKHTASDTAAVISTDALLEGRGIVESRPLVNRLKDSIVGILGQGGQTVGTGFVVDKRMLLTCEHVIGSAGSAPGKYVTVRFEIDHSEAQAQVDKKAWSPYEKDDIAVLHLERDVPEGATPLELISPQNSNGHNFSTFGFPKLAVVDGLGARGTIVETVHTKDGRHLLQIDSNQIDSGFSGAPVWDNELLKAVGMVRSALPSSAGGRLEDINFAVPGDVLQNILPKLSEETMAVLSNPFYAGGAVPSEMFVGRQDTLNLIRTRLGGRSPQSVSIVAERRMGKSSLLRYVCENSAKLFPGGKTIVICLDLMKAYTQTRRGLMSALRKELKPKLGYEPWEAGQDGDLTELSFALEKLGRDGVRLILCLDEVEHLTERKEEFDSLLEELRAAAGQGQVGLLTASARPLADLASSSGLTSPFYNIFIQETLGLLNEAEWRELVQRYLPNVSEEELAAIQRLCGGHPFYTQLAAGRLWEACCANGEADWQAKTREDLVPHWSGWWKHLKPEEQNALCFTAGFNDRKPSESMLKDLTRRGLLRNGKPFSEAFAEWMECKS